MIMNDPSGIKLG